MSLRPLVWLLVAVGGGCASPELVGDIHRYGRLDEQTWEQVETFDPDRHLDYSYVECGEAKTEVVFYWRSENEDWWVIDTYPASTPDIFRVVHLDRWDVTLSSVNPSKNADSVIDVDGSEAAPFGALVLKKYGHLMDLFPVWSAFPYALPECARTAFESR
ncbi:MAG: hypothetical protein AAGI89_08095 [Pseudomonadota bacterium]